MDSYDYMTQPQRDPYKLAWLEQANPEPPRKHVWREEDCVYALLKRKVPDRWDGEKGAPWEIDPPTRWG